MNSKVQSSKFEVQNRMLKFFRVVALPRLRFFPLPLIVYCSLFSVLAQNNLQKIEDGGFVRNWLVSNSFPAEIDAGAWENFNRFNIETLPQKDWLAPFGGVQKIKPQIGTFRATIQNQTSENPTLKIQNPASLCRKAARHRP